METYFLIALGVGVIAGVFRFHSWMKKNHPEDFPDSDF